MDVERERLVAHTRDAVAKGLASGNMWHAATNAEHARPMLQVLCPQSPILRHPCCTSATSESTWQALLGTSWTCTADCVSLQHQAKQCTSRERRDRIKRNLQVLM